MEFFPRQFLYIESLKFRKAYLFLILQKFIFYSVSKLKKK